MSLTDTLSLQGFGAYRGGRALSQPITLTLNQGTVLGVVGPNGVGKSSLLAALSGAGVQSYGSVSYADTPIASLTARQRASVISLLAQDTGAPAELRVHELVAVGALASKRPNVPDAVDTALAEAGIPELKHRRIGELSGGQRQLVQIARVLAQDTPVILFDEPTSALDLFHQREIEQTMRRLGNNGKIVIAALHDLSLALNACTQALLLDRDGGSHSGHPADVLRADLVHHAYGVHTAIHVTPEGRRYLTTTEAT